MTRNEKHRGKFQAPGAQIMVTEVPTLRHRRRASLHFGVIVGDDAATFNLPAEAGALLQRALEVLTDGRHRRH